jgi:hypothetical protein
MYLLQMRTPSGLATKKMVKLKWIEENSSKN